MFQILQPCFFVFLIIIIRDATFMQIRKNVFIKNSQALRGSLDLVHYSYVKV